jgi:hypothetical protein
MKRWNTFEEMELITHVQMKNMEPMINKHGRKQIREKIRHLLRSAPEVYRKDMLDVFNSLSTRTTVDERVAELLVENERLRAEITALRRSSVYVVNDLAPKTPHPHQKKKLEVGYAATEEEKRSLPRPSPAMYTSTQVTYLLGISGTDLGHKKAITRVKGVATVNKGLNGHVDQTCWLYPHDEVIRMIAKEQRLSNLSPARPARDPSMKSPYQKEGGLPSRKTVRSGQRVHQRSEQPEPCVT